MMWNTIILVATKTVIQPNPFRELFNSAQFWSAVVIALIGGSGIGGLASNFIDRHKRETEADKLTAEAAKLAVETLTNDVIKPLREQITYQEKQIEGLEIFQKRYWSMLRYVRGVTHWTEQAAQEITPNFCQTHPKPHLPDDIRAIIAPETISPQPPEQNK